MNASPAKGSSSEQRRTTVSLRAHLDAFDRGDIGRRRQIVDHGVEQRLHPLVFEGRTAQHRDKGAVERTLANTAFQRFLVRFLAAEISLQRSVVLLDRGFDKFRAKRFRFGRHLGRNVHDVELSAQGFLAPLDRPEANQIEHADKIAFDADRQLQHQRPGPETVGNHRDAAREICADAIHLVDKADPRHAVFVGLAPHRFRLRLDAGDRIEDRNRAVENPQAALDLDREIDMTGRVDDVDPMVLPEAGRRRRGDCDAALLLLRHPVHRGSAFVNFADLVRAPGIVQNPLGRGRLAGIDMRHDTDIPIPLEGCRACHKEAPTVSPAAAP